MSTVRSLNDDITSLIGRCSSCIHLRLCMRRLGGVDLQMAGNDCYDYTNVDAYVDRGTYEAEIKYRKAVHITTLNNIKDKAAELGHQDIVKYVEKTFETEVK